MCIVFSSIVPARAMNGLTRSDLEPFVGTWTLDASQSSAADPEWRQITLGDQSMRVEIHRPDDDRPPALVYNLDGTRRTNPFGAGSAVTEIRREQGDIVTSTVFTINERPVTVQERLKITAAGDLATVVIVRVEHGYQGVLPPLAIQPANVAQASKYFRRTR
jgi:hypothetical protein